LLRILAWPRFFAEWNRDVASGSQLTQAFGVRVWPDKKWNLRAKPGRKRRDT
jgi:hypothetical protein